MAARILPDRLNFVQNVHMWNTTRRLRTVLAGLSLLLVTGPLSRHMETALKRTYDATPEPKLVVAIGDCSRDGGIFGESYATRGGVANAIPVDVVVSGCPPAPNAILQGILTAISTPK